MGNGTRRLFASIGLCLLVLGGLIRSDGPTDAAEGPVAAGPLGGSDIRAAILPPPGVYGGILGLYNHVNSLRDGSGHPIAGLDAVHIDAKVAGAFLAYVPNINVFGGSIGIIGVFTGGAECGQVI